jgi:hypothetical protein
MREVLVEFENIIKEYQSVFFDKVWEKHENVYKLIYNIQGFVKDNVYYANLKFIFWLDENKNEIVEDVITYLLSQNCDYKSLPINYDNIQQSFETILSFINNDKTNNDLRYLLFDSLDDFNKTITQYDIQDFVQNIENIPHGSVSCPLTMFKYELTCNSDTYTFMLEYKDGWILIYNNERFQINIKDIPKKLIKIIHEI